MSCHRQNRQRNCKSTKDIDNANEDDHNDDNGDIDDEDKMDGTGLNWQRSIHKFGLSNYNWDDKSSEQICSFSTIDYTTLY